MRLNSISCALRVSTPPRPPPFPKMGTAFVPCSMPAWRHIPAPRARGRLGRRLVRGRPTTAMRSRSPRRASSADAGRDDRDGDRDGPVPVPKELAELRIVGLGACCTDMVAHVPAFPFPDVKMRTTRASMAGGGNCANTLTGARRLGLPCTFVSAVGDDAHGKALLDELRRDGIDTTHVRVVPGVSTAFTYVIVDEGTGSRTCIHTPVDREILPPEHLRSGEDGEGHGEVEEVVGAAILRGATLLHLDGRHTMAAIALATAANHVKVPVLLDVERDRPLLSALIPLANYVVTNSTFPHVFAPEAADTIDAMARILACGRARFVITTAGSAGATLVARLSDAPRGRQDPEILVTRELRRLPGLEHLGEIVILRCPAWHARKVVDTTGAGDAFISGVAYGLCVGLSLEAMLGLASRVAASKIQQMGARSGLPRREELALELLTAIPHY